MFCSWVRKASLAIKAMFGDSPPGRRQPRPRELSRELNGRDFRMILLVLGVRVATDFSLKPPHFETNVCEIGNWTVRGSATVSKQFIRLTSAVPNTVGTVCQRVPSLFRDWNFSVTVKCAGGSGGRGVFVFFTKELCPTMPLQFSGLSIWLNTSSRARSDSFGVYCAVNNGSELLRSHVGDIPASREPVALRVIRNGSSFAIEAGDLRNGLSRVGVLEDPNGYVPEFGFFTVSALTTQNATDNNDLFEIQTIEMSDRTNRVGPDISSTNRRLIENFVETRKIKKAERRSQMEVASKYTRTNVSVDLSDALKIANELRGRALLTMTAASLERFIDGHIAAKIGAAYQKIRFASENIDSARVEMREIWSDLSMRLGVIANEIQNEMEILARESKEAAASLRLNITDINRARKRMKEASMELTRQRFTRYIHLVCLLEAVFFVVFFLYQYHRRSRKFQ